MFVKFDDDSQADQNVLLVLDFNQSKHGVQHILEVLTQVVVGWQSMENLQDGLFGLMGIVFDYVDGFGLN